MCLPVFEPTTFWYYYQAMTNLKSLSGVPFDSSNPEVAFHPNVRWLRTNLGPIIEVSAVGPRHLISGLII